MPTEGWWLLQPMLTPKGFMCDVAQNVLNRRFRAAFRRFPELPRGLPRNLRKCPKLADFGPKSGVFGPFWAVFGLFCPTELENPKSFQVAILVCFAAFCCNRRGLCTNCPKMYYLLDLLICCPNWYIMMQNMIICETWSKMPYLLGKYEPFALILLWFVHLNWCPQSW